MLCLGIDSGPKSQETLVLDTASGDVVALAQCNYARSRGCRRDMSSKLREHDESHPAPLSSA